MRSSALAFFIGLMFFAQSGFAARVIQVKGSQVLVDLEGDSANSVINKRYIVMVGDKRRAIIEIKKAKGQKAVGTVLKGKAVVDGTLVEITKTTAKKSSRDESEDTSSQGSTTDAATYGVLLGMNMASQKVTFEGSNDSVSMTGNGFALKGFGDFPVLGNLSLLGRAGVEQFNVKADDNKTEIMYFNGDLLVKYRFMDSTIQPFVMAGLSLHYPLTKSSDALIEDNISMTTALLLGGGLNYFLSDSMYIMVNGEYAYFPPAESVTTSFIAFYGGVGFKF
ncbi:MAG TPA: hypothetical protein VM432_10875 [Bdellovibrionales bacterium]|nr:hypothetical protein [Bdellovibrionales bacterium]